MRRFCFFCLTFIVLGLHPACAQFAVGLRPSLSTYGGYDDRLRAEVSLMTGMIGNRSRMEFDMGWGHRPVYTVGNTNLVNGQLVSSVVESRELWGSATALWQWKHRLLWRLHYYGGLGSTAFFSENGVDILALDVQFGLEWQMRIPITITVDYRPMLDVLDGLVYYHTIGLGVRYRFSAIENEPEPSFVKRWKRKLFRDDD